MIGELEIYETDSYSSAHVVLIRAIEQKLAFVTQQEVFITNQLMFKQNKRCVQKPVPCFLHAVSAINCDLFKRACAFIIGLS